MRVALYFARVLVGTILLTLCGLVVLTVVLSLVEEARRLAQVDMGIQTGLTLALFSSAGFAGRVLPIACLVGTVVVGTRLGKSGELVALQTCGLNPSLVSRVFLGVIVLFCAAGVLWGDSVAPRANRHVERILREELAHRPDALDLFFTRRHTWYQDGDRILYLPTVDQATGIFRDVLIYRMSEGRIHEILEARILRYVDGQWSAEGATRRTFPVGEVSHYKKMPIRLSIGVHDLMQVSGDPRRLSSSDVADLIDRRRGAGLDASAHLVELHNRFAYPLLGALLFLLAAPWVLDPARRRSVAGALGIAVIGQAVVLAVAQVLRLLALGRSIPAPLGAWGIDALCLACIPISWWLHKNRLLAGHSAAKLR